MGIREKLLEVDEECRTRNLGGWALCRRALSLLFDGTIIEESEARDLVDLVLGNDRLRLEFSKAILITQPWVDSIKDETKIFFEGVIGKEIYLDSLSYRMSRCHDLMEELKKGSKELASRVSTPFFNPEKGLLMYFAYKYPVQHPVNVSFRSIYEFVDQKSLDDRRKGKDNVNEEVGKIVFIPFKSIVFVRRSVEYADEKSSFKTYSIGVKPEFYNREHLVAAWRSL